MGLVSHVYDTKSRAVEEAIRMGGLISSKSPIAVVGTKEVLNYSRDHSVEDGEFDCTVFEHWCWRACKKR